MALLKILLNDSYFSKLLSGRVKLGKQQFSLSLHAGKVQWNIKESPRFLLGKKKIIQKSYFQKSLFL